MADPLPAAPRVLDVACGPGAQTIDLANLLPGAAITALDLHPPFVAELRKRAAAAGVSSRITAIEGDMAAMPFAARSFDLIWCEGAAYIAGVAKSLETWRPLLRSGGKVAFTEAVWLKDNAPEKVKACWAEYPAMGSSADVRRIAGNAGYDLVGDFVLPESAWWDDYYAPMERRIAALRSRYAGDTVAQTVIDEAQGEIEVYRQYAEYYGYVFVVLRVR